MFAGCITTDDPTEPLPSPTTREAADPLLQPAMDMYAGGDYANALLELVELSYNHPQLPGLEPLRKEVIAAEMDRRAQLALQRQEELDRRSALDITQHSSIPDTFSTVQVVTGDTNDLFKAAGRMQEILETPVSMHIKGGDLGAFIKVLSSDSNINIIADSGLGSGKKVDVNVDDVPLREILDYLARNMGVNFHLGENTIWVTAASQKGSQPLETRIYRLKKGVQFHGRDWGAPDKDDANRADLGVLARKATVLSQEKTPIEILLEQFVPAVEGHVIHFDKNTHTLFVKNTPSNFRQIQRIIETLDVNPAQVFIEARFIEVNSADLRELGIDWVLNSPWVTSSKAVFENGQLVRNPKTSVGADSSVSFQPFTSDEIGAFPLGPQGAFGLNRPGNPSTAGQGLNLEFQGILTEPMFEAVIHALDISGKGRTLSVPRVTTVNNNPAKLRNGEDLRYYEEFEAQAFQVLDDNNRKTTLTALTPKGRPTLEELGITLIAVPSVGADLRTIQLMIQPTISRLDGFLSFQEEGLDEDGNPLLSNIRQVEVKLPIFSRREVQTKVIVESGETVVMGGLIDTVTQDTNRGVPFLSQLPFFGKLFGRQDATEENRNLLIFVTATVISERGISLVARPEKESETRAPAPLRAR